LRDIRTTIETGRTRAGFRRFDDERTTSRITNTLYEWATSDSDKNFKRLGKVIQLADQRLGKNHFSTSLHIKKIQADIDRLWAAKRAKANRNSNADEMIRQHENFLKKDLNEVARAFQSDWSTILKDLRREEGSSPNKPKRSLALKLARPVCTLLLVSEAASILYGCSSKNPQRTVPINETSATMQPTASTVALEMTTQPHDEKIDTQYHCEIHGERDPSLPMDVVISGTKITVCTRSFTIQHPIYKLDDKRVALTQEEFDRGVAILTSLVSNMPTLLRQTPSSFVLSKRPNGIFAWAELAETGLLTGGKEDGVGGPDNDLYIFGLKPELSDAVFRYTARHEWGHLWNHINEKNLKDFPNNLSSITWYGESRRNSSVFNLEVFAEIFGFCVSPVAFDGFRINLSTLQDLGATEKVDYVEQLLQNNGTTLSYSKAETTAYNNRIKTLMDSNPTFITSLTGSHFNLFVSRGGLQEPTDQLKEEYNRKDDFMAVALALLPVSNKESDKTAQMSYLNELMASAFFDPQLANKIVLIAQFFETNGVATTIPSNELQSRFKYAGAGRIDISKITQEIIFYDKQGKPTGKLPYTPLSNPNFTGRVELSEQQSLLFQQVPSPLNGEPIVTYFFGQKDTGFGQAIPPSEFGNPFTTIMQ